MSKRRAVLLGCHVAPAVHSCQIAMSPLTALLVELEGRLAALDTLGHTALSLTELSATNQAFLQPDVSGDAFAAAWPPDARPDSDSATLAAFLSAVDAARRLDARLQKRCDKLVPRKVSDTRSGRGPPRRARV